MKKRIISLLMALVMVLSMVPAASAADVTITVETIVEPQYEAAATFSDGYAAVMKDGKWGYIDESGNVAVDFKYDWAGMYSEGVAITGVRETLIYGDGVDWTEDVYVIHMIDMEGHDQVLYDESLDDWMMVPNGYDHYPVRVYLDGETGLPYEEELAEMDSTWYANNGVVNVGGTLVKTSGEVITFDDFDLLPDPADWEWEQSYYDYAVADGPCVDGLIPMVAGVMGLADGCEQTFLIDTDGNLVKVFEPAANFSEGTGISQIHAPDNGLVLACQLAGTVPDEWGYCYTRYGVMDMNGNWVIAPEYINYYVRLNGDIFGEDLLPMCNVDEKWGVFNTQGQIVVPFAYDWISIYAEGYASAMKDGKCLYVDARGNEYQIGGLDGGVANISICSNFNSDGLAAVWNADTGEAYCISDTPVNGVFPAVPGSENIDAEVYFPGYTGEGVPSYIQAPASIIAIEENGLYGYAKVTIDDGNPFDDVYTSDYYYEPVLWAVQNGITQGTDPGKFSPEDDCTRAQVVTFLWRAAGEPEPESLDNPFDDVKIEDYFYKAVLWAVEKGVTVGTDSNAFSPEDTCTRAQVATFLWRYTVAPDLGTGNPFTDVPAGEYYAVPVTWAVAVGLTQGTSATTFSPEDTCTRAQIVTFLYRLESIPKG